jgi:hypothetical protein
MGREYEIIGKTFGKLTVIERAENRNTRQSWWTCRCDCGKETEIRGLKLVSGHTKSCGCLKSSKPASNFKGYMDIAGKYWSRLMRHAKTRDLKFEISLEDAWKIFENQKGKCALTGLEITLNRNLEESYQKINRQTASLDRIDSNKHYVADNIQWVHIDVNRMKNNLPEERLFFLCEQIYLNKIRKDVDYIP